MKLASIDLGTNTCNLAIADWSPQKINMLFSEKQAIKLGAEGFKDGNISDAAIERIFKALHHYQGIINTYKVSDVQIFATSGLRNAANQQAIIRRITQEIGYKVNLISGEQEAEFIYQGVCQAVPLDENPCVLLDIGGGSNEIQIVNHKNVFWRKSFDLGIARLLLKFNPSDPLKPEEIKAVNTYLEQALTELKPLAETYQPTTLIGSSGSFDTFVSLYFHSIGLSKQSDNQTWTKIPFDFWDKIYRQLTQSTREERLAMPGMEAMRVEMIPLASVFTNFLIHLLPIKTLIQSDYALKEGVFKSMAKNLI